MISSRAESGGEGVRVKRASLDLLLVIPSLSQMPQCVGGVKTSSGCHDAAEPD